MNKLPMPFGNPTTYPGHQGVDYGQRLGTPIPASGRGRISKRTSTQNGGYKVWVDYDEFPAGCDVGYAHLDNYNQSPPVGTVVNYGDTIGLVGNTGLSTGPHLHSEVEGHFTTEGYWQFFDSGQVVNNVAPNQRVAGPYGAKARRDPSTNEAPVEEKYLPAGTVGTFDGWINGQPVEGNAIWFRGAYSGLWFWSGGFTDTGTHDLPDLNPPSLKGYQRQVVSHASANGRSEPTRSADIVQELPAGTVGDFDGWMNGEPVEGNSVWFRGMHSGNWFWSGGFTDKGTHDLADLNPKPEPDKNRTVGANSANVRDVPYTSSPTISSAAPGTVIAMLNWAHAQSVQGNDVWFQRGDGDWMWSGGFTSQATAGLKEVTAPPEPAPPSPNNPRGLKEYPPAWPLAAQALEAPLGFTDCKNPTVRVLRDTKGKPPVPTPPLIDLYVIHWTGVLNDQLDYFSYCNDRSVCPTTYMRRDGWQSEMIRPGCKPATNGPTWNYRIFAVETLAAPGADFTPEQWEAHAQNIALLAEYDGKELDGVPVSFKIDRAHVVGHRELDPGVECPGDAQMAGLDALIARAQAIYDEKHPEPEPDVYTVPRELGDQIRDLVNKAFPEK